MRVATEGGGGAGLLSQWDQQQDVRKMNKSASESRLDKRKSLFSQWLVNQWNRLPSEVFTPCLADALSHRFTFR